MKFLKKLSPFKVRDKFQRCFFSHTIFGLGFDFPGSKKFHWPDIGGTRTHLVHGCVRFGARMYFMVHGLLLQVTTTNDDTTMTAPSMVL